MHIWKEVIHMCTTQLSGTIDFFLNFHFDIYASVKCVICLYVKSQDPYSKEVKVTEVLYIFFNFLMRYRGGETAKLYRQ